MEEKVIEQEFKIMLSLEEYERIYRSVNWDEDIIQINHYFDNEELYCLNNGTTVRVREKEEELVLQVKALVEYEGSIHVKEEFEETIDSLPDTIESEKLKRISKINIPSVDYIGSLKTFRKTAFKDGICICLDENYYNDYTDYEIEIEFNTENKPRAEKLLKTFLLDKGIKSDSKFTRFYKSLKRKVALWVKF